MSSDQPVFVCVRGLDLRKTSHETIFLYFESKRRSGVDQVNCMVRDFKDQLVYISFPTEEDAFRVFRGSHTLDHQKLDVSLVKMPDVMTKRLAVRDLPQDISLNSLQEFIHKKTGETVVSMDNFDGVVLLDFQRTIDPAKTQSTLRNEDINGYTILVDPLLVTNKVMVSGLPKTPPVTKQALDNALSSFAVVTQTELAASGDKALITLQDAKAAEAVDGKTIHFGKHDLRTYLFFDRIGMEFQPVEASLGMQGLQQQLQKQLMFSLQPAPKQKAQSLLRAQTLGHYTVGDIPTFAALSESKLKAATQQRKSASSPHMQGHPSPSLGVTNRAVTRETISTVNTKAVIRASPANYQYCKENRIGEEVIGRGLRVQYNTTDESIELEGREEDVAEMRQLVDMTLGYVHTASHTWDTRLPVEIRTSEAVEGAIREACRKQGFVSNNAIAFNAKGFEVAVWEDLQQAQRMRDMAAEMLTIKETNTPGADGVDTSQKERWMQLVSSLQRQNENKVVLRENSPKQLLVMGIQEAVDNTVRKLNEFLTEHSEAERQFSLPHGDTEHLFWEFFSQAHQSCLIQDENIKVRDGQVLVNGNKDVIQTAEKLMGDFKRYLVTTQKTIKEPGIQRLMKTNEWKSSCKRIESEHQCKIVAEDDQGWRPQFAATPTSPQFQFAAAPTFPQFDAGFSPPLTFSMSTQNVSSKHPSALGELVADRPKIHLYSRADLIKDEHELLVNSTQTSLELNTGKVSRALLIAGGQSIQDECHAKYPNGIRLGDVAITDGGQLFCKKLAHCCLPETQDKQQMKNAVKNSVTKCLEKAEKYGLDSVGFPAIGTGTLRYPPDIVAKAMYEATLAYGRQNPGTVIDDVSFVLLTEDVHNHGPFQKEHDSYKKRLRESACGRQDTDENLYQSLVNPQAQGVRSYKHFSNTKETATFRILALKQTSARAAGESLLKCYRDNVKRPTYDTQYLEEWDSLQLCTLQKVCEQVHVDLHLNFSLNRIDLQGLVQDLEQVSIHDIIKEGEEGAHMRRNALMMSRQVQWSRIDAGRTEEFLTPYDMIKNYKIEDAYRNQKQSVMFGVTYIDFAKWKELPETDGDVNYPHVSIHRHSITEQAATGKPDHWSDMGSNTLDVIPLQSNTPEYERIEGIFSASMDHPSTKVIQISRVQNLTLYRQYTALKREMSRTTKKCERETLWHGTKEKNVDGIIHFGFNRSWSGDKKRCAHGQGVYFATKAAYSCQNQYAKKNKQKERRLFLCKALVGRYIKGDQDMRVPDYNVHDSAVDDVNNPAIFVIFKDVQAYPEYLIVCKDT